MTDFDKLLSKTIGSAGPEIISEQHDVSKIDISTQADEWDESTVKRTRIETGWDAGEYGVSYEEAKRLSETEEGRAELRRRAIERMGLDTSRGQVAVMVAGEAPWHRLGVNVAEAVRGADVNRLAALDNWNLKTFPTHAYVMLHDGGQLEVPTGKFAIARTDTGAILHPNCSDQYRIFHNEDAVQLLDSLIDGGGKFVTAGAIGQGETVWWQCENPGNLKFAEGDEAKAFVMLSNSHDGTGSIKLQFCVDRAVCRNTYRTIQRSEAGSGLRMQHRGKLSAKVEKAKAILRTAQTQAEKFAEMAQHLASVDLGQHEVRGYFDRFLDRQVGGNVAGEAVTQQKIVDGTIGKAIAALQPQYRETEESKLRRIENRREKVMDDLLTRFHSERNNGLQSISGSVWAACNAVTEHVQHSGLVRYQGDDTKREESRFRSILDGAAHRLTDHAVELAQQLAG